MSSVGPGMSEAPGVPGVHDRQDRYLQMALIGHYVRSTNVEVHMELSGGTDCRSIWGHSTTVMKLWPDGPPVVVLFSDDSTPQKAEVHPDAAREFQAAAERLIRDGVEFYTVLRPGWAWPALQWTLEYRR